jgi:hypothetical protein
MGLGQTKLNLTNPATPSDIYSYDNDAALTDNSETNIIVGDTGKHARIEIKASIERNNSWQHWVFNIYNSGGTIYDDGGVSFGTDIGVTNIDSDVSGTDIRLKLTLSSTGNNATIYYDIFKTKK